MLESLILACLMQPQSDKQLRSTLADLATGRTGVPPIVIRDEPSPIIDAFGPRPRPISIVPTPVGPADNRHAQMIAIIRELTRRGS